MDDYVFVFEHNTDTAQLPIPPEATKSRRMTHALKLIGMLLRFLLK